MATRDVDTTLHIYLKVENTTIGQDSVYTTHEHLGTSQTIDGWKWDERYWPTDQELEAIAFAPSIWDASTNGLDNTYFQSGYGDNNDLLLLEIERNNVSGVESWTPRVHTGYFYNRDQEWYLYSDWFQTQQFRADQTASGLQYLDLSYDYKDTYPIQIRRFQFNRITGEETISLDFIKKVIMTVSGDDPEFEVDTTYYPPRLWLNDIYSEEVGATITFVSGVASSTIVNSLELVGTSDGSSSQEFRTEYSPIDVSQPLEVWTHKTLLDLQQWTVLSGVQPFSAGENYEVKVDTDTGSLLFGSYSDGSGSGIIPSTGSKIRIRYTKSMSAMYEPEFAQDYVSARTADVNPTNSPTKQGFIQITTANIDPAYIVLTASGMSQQSGYYLSELGNNFEKLVANVTDINEDPVEAADVTFEILLPQTGSFGGTRRTAQSPTNASGNAYIIYNTPTVMEDVGRMSYNPTVVGSTTTLNVEDMVVPSSISGVFLYRVQDNDLAIGVPEGSIDDFYEDYIEEQGYTASGYEVATAEWEEQHRTIWGIAQPVTFDPTEDPSGGRKTIVLTNGYNYAVDPHDGQYDSNIYIPLHPSSYEIIASGLEPEIKLTYPAILPGIGTDHTRGYLVVSENRAKVRAYTRNESTGEIIYSNTIQIKIQIPSTMNGTIFAEALSDVTQGLLTRAWDADTMAVDTQINPTSGIADNYNNYLDERTLISGIWETYAEWFRRTRRGDTAMLVEAAASGIAALDGGLPVVQYQVAGLATIPVGFRLKSTGIRLASMLDQITYLDPNDHLASGYFDLPDDYYL